MTILEKLEDGFPLVVINNAILVRHDEKDFIAAWASMWNEGEPTDYSQFSVLTVTDTEGNLIKSDLAGTSNLIKAEARNFRIKQIQKEFGISDDRVPTLDVILEILDRVWADEWMGQNNTGRNIYFSELADLLNTTQADIWPLFFWLFDNGLATQSGGLILYPPTEDIDSLHPIET